MSGGQDATRRQRLRASGWLWAIHIALGAAIGQRWLTHVHAGADLRAELFMQAALVSTMAMLSAVVALPLLASSAAIRSPRILVVLHALAWGAFLLMLYADTVIYGMFRYHFNGLVWHELTTPGSEDAIHLDARLWTEVAIGMSVVLLGEVLLFRWLSARVAKARSGGPRWRSRGAWVAAVVVALVLFEKGSYAWADLVRDRSITARGSLFPLYQPLTIKDLVGKRRGMELARRETVDLGREGVLIRYPIQRPVLPAATPRPNVLIVVIDSLRHDAMTPEIMPRLSKWAEGARRFQQHVSGGNSTRFGIFSLIYGLHGSYWAPILNEQAPPVLVSALVEAGYEPRVLSSASMSSPEFRSTCWIGIESSVQDALSGAEKYLRDRNLAAEFNAWIAARDAARPFFAFALIDSPHQTYSVDPERTPFRPYLERVDYLKMASEPSPEQIELVLNRYKNACAAADDAVASMLDGLERLGLAKDTLVLITGDHGEEFYEHGHFGHTSNFTAVQTHVACALAGPGIAPGDETRPTSHVDVAPTLLERLGVSPDLRADYSVGLNMLDPPAQRLRAIAGWQEMALWLDGGVLYVPMEGHKGLVSGFHYDWRPMDDDRALIESGRPALIQLSEECRRFLR